MLQILLQMEITFQVLRSVFLENCGRKGTLYFRIWKKKDLIKNKRENIEEAEWTEKEETWL